MSARRLDMFERTWMTDQLCFSKNHPRNLLDLQRESHQSALELQPDSANYHSPACVMTFDHSWLYTSKLDLLRLLRGQQSTDVLPAVTCIAQACLTKLLR